jgi:hypothetical protein
MLGSEAASVFVSLRASRATTATASIASIHWIGFASPEEVTTRSSIWRSSTFLSPRGVQIRVPFRKHFVGSGQTAEAAWPCIGASKQKFVLKSHCHPPRGEIEKTRWRRQFSAWFIGCSAVPSSINRRYLPEVDQLRAIAAVLVLFYHGLQLFGARLTHGADFSPSQHWLYPSNPIIAIIEEGHSGVSLFIVLSGFILSLGAIGNTVGYKPFLIARFLRIYPMLVVCLVVAISVRPTSLVSQITTLLPVNASGGVDSPFTSMFWAVALEFQCYLIFPLLIAFSNKHGSRFLLQVIAVALLLRLLAILADGANARDISYWTVIGRIDQFCIGIIAARLYVERNLNTLSARWFLPTAIVAALVLWEFNRLGGLCGPRSRAQCGLASLSRISQRLGYCRIGLAGSAPKSVRSAILCT